MRCAKTRAHICITLVGLARVDCYGIYFILIKLSFDMSAHRASAKNTMSRRPTPLDPGPVKCGG